MAPSEGTPTKSFTAIAADRQPRPPAMIGIVLGVAGVVALTALKLVFPSIGAPTPFLLYFGAVLLAAWYGGLMAGLAATATAAISGQVFFLDPYGSLGIGSRDELAQLAVFVLEGVGISAITSRLRHDRWRAHVAAGQARTALAKLSVVMRGVDDGITVQDRSGALVFANASAASMTGFQSADELLSTPLADVMERFELLTEDGQPMPLEELPARRVLDGAGPQERLLRFRVRASGNEQWSLVRANPVAGPDGEVEFAVNVFRDVTEKRRHDEALRVSQEWFSTALNSIGDAVIATDRAGRITFVNPVAEQLTGWSSAEANGLRVEKVFTIVDETSRSPVESPVQRVMREGAAVGVANPTILTRRDRQERAIEDSAAPILDSAGELVGVVLVFRDVSIKRGQEARRAFLVQATEELGSSLDYQVTLATVARLAVPRHADWCAVDILEGDRLRRLAVAHVDPAKIEFVSEIERRYPPDPSSGRGAWNILRTGRSEMIAEIPDSLIESAARDADHLALIRQLGLRSYIGTPIRRGESVIGVITMVMAESSRLYQREDLELAESLADRASAAVERARLFRELEQARIDVGSERDRLHDLIMNAPAAICIQRGAGHVYDLVNSPYRELFSNQDLVGRSALELGLDPESLRVLDRVFQSGESTSSIEQKIVAAWDGSGQRTARYFNQTIQPLRNAGAIEGVVTFAVDVSEQVTARHKLERATAEAELANRSKDEFLAMLGHELRNPLAPILTALQLMKLRAGDLFERERTIIERQVRHVVRLVDDLLDVSRITRGKIEIRREPVDISEVVAKAIEMASPLIERRGHDVQIAIEPGLIVQGDAIRLAQVVANILNNAAKYTENGGEIRIGARAVDGKMVLRVADNGMGIAPEMLPRIFDLFVQEPQALDRAHGGLGLGLAIAHSLIALHGGTLRAHSEGLGRGSEFVIELSLLADQPRASAARIEPMQAVDNPRAARVLIVDDNEDALGLLSEALQLLGHETLCATDGPQALSIAERATPAIALLDIGLPVMDGYELARRLRELPGLGQIRLVAVTGYGQGADRDRSAQAGFDAHMVKPVTIESLQKTIDRLVGDRPLPG